MPRQCSVLRVFTRDGKGGNHLGVVTELDGLDGAAMQTIAADLGFSETVFIAIGAVPEVRIFTPSMELPFAGHPLVGAAHYLFRSGVAGDRIKCGIGEVKIRHDRDMTWIDAPMFHERAYRDGAIFAMRVGLKNPVSTWRVEMPLDYRIVELATPEEVAAADPDPSAFGVALGAAVYARSGRNVRMRFFAPGAGVFEDPATGSAAVALATRFAAAGEPNGSATIDQGEEIGHPSRIELHWEGRSASIGGTVAVDEPVEIVL
ncbi:MAG: PhzF family phenazine biosynthesis protein [Acidimicrobiia bacterium]|nr:PhzF family phenazine biosynthesis protein [Acidimicrobiia bacterium]